jgi:hypothetical protein
MKNINIILFSLFSNLFIFSQSEIILDKTIGGSNYDYPYEIHYNSDSSAIFLIGHSSSSNSGDKLSVGFGFTDIWIIKTDVNFNIIWEKSYGGSLGEIGPTSSVLKNDTIYVLCVSNSGISGNKTSENFGGGDLWCFSIDTNGDFLWQKNYGGTNEEFSCEMILLNNNNLLLSTITNSSVSGNKSLDLKGETDVWLIEVEKENGNIINEKAISNYNNTPYATWSVFQQPITNNLFFFLRASSGTTDEKTEQGYGQSDIWLLEMDENFSKIRDKCFGGSESESIPESVFFLDNFIYIFAGSKSNISGNKLSSLSVSTSPTNFDTWYLKLDSNLNTLIDRSYGGSYLENLSKTVLSKENYYFTMLINSWSSDSGDKESINFDPIPANSSDIWVLVINKDGEIISQNCYGGNNLDKSFDCLVSNSNDLIILAETSSGISGNKTSLEKGLTDFWIFEIEATNILSISSILDVPKSLNVYPNPFKNKVNFDLTEINEDVEISIFDMNGRLIESFKAAQNKIAEWESNLQKQVLFYKIHGNITNLSGKIICE